MGARRGYDVLQEQTFRQLQTLPNVGPALAGGLVRCGVASLDDLSRRDPRRLFDQLAGLEGGASDPAVLDVLATAIHAARTGLSAPWWEHATDREPFPRPHALL